jgi:uncharacterized protein YfbU (UPF0304 family)
MCEDGRPEMSPPKKQLILFDTSFSKKYLKKVRFLKERQNKSKFAHFLTEKF